eukprot:403331949
MSDHPQYQPQGVSTHIPHQSQQSQEHPNQQINQFPYQQPVDIPQKINVYHNQQLNQQMNDDTHQTSRMEDSRFNQGDSEYNANNESNIINQTNPYAQQHQVLQHNQIQPPHLQQLPMQKAPSNGPLTNQQQYAGPGQTGPQGEIHSQGGVSGPAPHQMMNPVGEEGHNFHHQQPQPNQNAPIQLQQHQPQPAQQQMYQGYHPNMPPQPQYQHQPPQQQFQYGQQHGAINPNMNGPPHLVQNQIPQQQYPVQNNIPGYSQGYVQQNYPPQHMHQQPQPQFTNQPDQIMQSPFQTQNQPQVHSQQHQPIQNFQHDQIAMTQNPPQPIVSSPVTQEKQPSSQNVLAHNISFGQAPPPQQQQQQIHPHQQVHPQIQGHQQQLHHQQIPQATPTMQQQLHNIPQQQMNFNNPNPNQAHIMRGAENLSQTSVNQNMGSNTNLQNIGHMGGMKQEESKNHSRVESSQNLNGLGDHTFNNEANANTNGNMNSPKAQGKEVGFVTANIYQSATLNKLLPRGFKIELTEAVQRNHQQRLAQLLQKKNAAAAAQKKKKSVPPPQIIPQYVPLTKQPSKLNENSMGASELADSDELHALNKSGQRISAREKRPVNYNSMAAGTGEISASMDYGEVSGQNQRAVQKKPGNLNNPKEVKQRCETLFQTLKCHPSISLFLSPLEISHPRFAEIQPDFINLHKIELNFQQGKYNSTFNLGNDFRKMWQVGLKLYAEDPIKINKIHEIQIYFDQIFQELENKPLPTQPATQFQTIETHPPIQQAPKSNAQQMSKKIEKIQKELQQMKDKTSSQAQSTKNQRTINQIQNTIHAAQQSNLSDKPMTPQEKSILKDFIGQLTPEQQRGIIEIVADIVGQNNSDIFEFELDSLPNRKCRELDVYVRKCMSLNQKKQKRKEADALRRQQQKAMAQKPSGQQMSQQNIQPLQQQMSQQYPGQMTGVPMGQAMQQQIPPQQQYMQQMQPMQQQPLAHQMPGQMVPQTGQVINPMVQGQPQAQAMMGGVPGQMMHQQHMPPQQQIPGQVPQQYQMMGQAPVGGAVGTAGGHPQAQQAPINQNFQYGRRENLNDINDSESDSDSDDSDSDDDNIKKGGNQPAPSNNISQLWRKQQQNN